MYRRYSDIRDKLGEPWWHDEQGVPRYCFFHPWDLGVYDHWAALLRIRCQGCGRTFLVADGYSVMDLIRPTIGTKMEAPDSPVLPTPDNLGGSFCFGDAPWHADELGQCSGTTMTTDTVQVVEFWIKKDCEWQRHPEYEFSYPLDGQHEEN